MMLPFVPYLSPQASAITASDSGIWVNNGLGDQFQVGATSFTNHDGGLQNAKIKAFSSSGTGGTLDGVCTPNQSVFYWGYHNLFDTNDDAAKSLGAPGYKYFIVLDGSNNQSQAITGTVYTIVKSSTNNDCVVSPTTFAIAIAALSASSADPFIYFDTMNINPQDVPVDNFYTALKDACTAVMKPANCVYDSGYNLDISEYSFGLVSQEDDAFYTAISKYNVKKDQVVYTAGTSDCPTFIVLSGTLTNGITPSTGILYVNSINPGTSLCQNGILKSGGGKGPPATASFGLPFAVKIANSATFDKDIAANATMAEAPGSNGGGGDDTKVDKCGGLSGLGWLICPLIMLMDDIITKLKDAVKGMLEIDLTKLNSGNSLKVAWSTMRLISTVVLIGIALFVIISQILGMEFVSAYTIKKMIPRLVIAIILIQLSWVIMLFVVDFVNILGEGLQALMFGPFGGAAKMNDVTAILQRANISGAGSNTGLVVLFGVGVGVFATTGGLFGILAIAVGVAAALIVGIVSLILRKIIILALIVIAPLAIVAWILPNTEKYFKMWYSNLTKLLLMFPLIMGLLAIGPIFASIAADGNAYTVTGDGTGGAAMITFFVILIAYFAPFFFIPKTFSMSGTLMASASGAMGKIGGKMIAPAQKLTKEKGTAWAESKYMTGHRKSNFAVRLATGNVAPTYSSGAALAGRASKLEEQRKAEDASLLNRSVSNLDYADRVKKYQDLAGSKNTNPRIAAAAQRQLLAQGNLEELDEARKNSPAGQKAFDKLMKGGGDFGKEIATKRPDMAMDPAALKSALANYSAEDVAKLDNSFFKPGVSGREHLSTDLLKQTRDSPYYGSMKKDARAYIQARVGAPGGGASPYAAGGGGASPYAAGGGGASPYA
ncbi:MAG: hypothetical protein WCP03_01890, partial [Candidatus Saccharibacteria bacterium]